MVGLRGVVKPGAREAHIIGEMHQGAAIALCGKDVRIYPLDEADRLRTCEACERYAEIGRAALRGIA